MKNKQKPINTIVDQAIKELQKAPKEEWPEIYHRLDRDHWDDRLGPEPDDWAEMPWALYTRFRKRKKKHGRQRRFIVNPILSFISLYVDIDHRGEMRKAIDDYILKALKGGDNRYQVEWVVPLLDVRCRVR